MEQDGDEHEVEFRVYLFAVRGTLACSPRKADAGTIYQEITMPHHIHGCKCNSVCDCKNVRAPHPAPI
jgi:hypothetical protein